MTLGVITILTVINNRSSLASKMPPGVSSWLDHFLQVSLWFNLAAFTEQVAVNFGFQADAWLEVARSEELAKLPIKQKLLASLSAHRERLVQLFAEWDVDGDGKLSLVEFHRAIEALGAAKGVPNSAVRDFFTNELGGSAKHSVSLAKFERMLKKGYSQTDEWVSAGAVARSGLADPAGPVHGLRVATEPLGGGGGGRPLEEGEGGEEEEEDEEAEVRASQDRDSRRSAAAAPPSPIETVSVVVDAGGAGRRPEGPHRRRPEGPQRRPSSIGAMVRSASKKASKRGAAAARKISLSRQAKFAVFPYLAKLRFGDHYARAIFPPLYLLTVLVLFGSVDFGRDSFAKIATATAEHGCLEA